MTKTIPIIEERAHAILSASGSKKWLNCTPSARFEEQFPDPETAFSAEGTWMHHCAAHRLRAFLGLPQEFEKERDIPGFEKFANAETSEAVHAYVRRCVHAIEQAMQSDPNTMVLVEEKGDFSRWVPEGFGTADLAVISQGTARVRDLKGGKGLRVDVEDNTQLMIYALTIIAAFHSIYEFDDIIVEIDQPRMNNVAGNDSPMKVADLLKWAEEYVKPRAALAWEGKGEFNPGEWCVSGFCRARFVCAARAAAMADLVDKDFDEDPDGAQRLSDAEIAQLQPRLAGFIKWAKDLQEHVEAQALAGKRWPGLKIVEGRSNRKITDPDGLADVLEFEGFQRPLLYEMPTPPAMLGLGALEKLVGKKKFIELSDGFVNKPKGKPTLVPDSDPRPVFVPEGNADADFDDDEED